MGIFLNHKIYQKCHIHRAVFSIEITDNWKLGKEFFLSRFISVLYVKAALALFWEVAWIFLQSIAVNNKFKNKHTKSQGTKSWKRNQMFLWKLFMWYSFLRSWRYILIWPGMYTKIIILYLKYLRIWIYWNYVSDN